MAIFDLSLLARLGAILGILVDALWLFALTQASTHLSLLSPLSSPGPIFTFPNLIQCQPSPHHRLPCTSYMKKVYKIRNREKLIQI